jgi:hypothetical protein
MDNPNMMQIIGSLKNFTKKIGTLTVLKPIFEWEVVFLQINPVKIQF